MKTIQTIIIFVLYFYSAVSVAGVVNKELEASVEASAKGSMQTPPKSSLRCWQKGKLLFDESDYGLSTSNNNVRMIKFNHNQSRGRSLGLINLGETLCVYQKSE